MKAKTFKYRQIVLLFLGLCAALQAVFLVWISRTTEQAQRPVYLGLAAVAVVAAIFLIRRYLLEGVAIDDATLEWFDGFGRRRSVPLSGIQSVEKFTPALVTHGIEIRTDAGPLRVRKTLLGYYMFRNLVEAALDGKPVSSYRFTPKNATVESPVKRRAVYRYVLSSTHFASLLWLIVGAVSTLAVWQHRASTPGGFRPLILLPFCLTILAVGVWMHLVGWIERIVITPDRITWIDFLGRRKVSAPLAEIIEMDQFGKVSYDVSSNQGFSGMERSDTRVLQIETTEGTIRVSAKMWFYKELKKQVREIINAYQGSRIGEAGEDILEPSAV